MGTAAPAGVCVTLKRREAAGAREDGVREV